MAKKPVSDDVAVVEDELSPVARVRKDATPQLSKDALRPSGTLCGIWDGVAQAEHSIEDALHPRYLWSRAAEMSPLDLVNIVHVHGLWEVELRIIRVDHQARGVHARIRNVWDYTKAERVVSPKLTESRIEYLGARKWAIIDGHHVVKDEFATRSAAEAWLEGKV